ncbi:pyrimidine 5-nucleotidase [Conidiobolus coronatus NRRL 28638]|uniref:Pyrimidine 5-nucleotidase n=1 Tax=Conidiobolus coronatus (strain ATCC 28846 / CBS 209.66 / NRRL 28638) TaxID=796925 RepID=A0A137PDA4_CONC2|nr:pyrimidine 5-nucleotidase [Conidiobolus coronatus NRRL 28638]|eukprot:KXN72921.1 pyrimidine 5-nucleotidase [Conidiobolus coronatus NRRL 28638]
MLSSTNGADTNKDICFFFDIDNCLYDANTGIPDLMAERINLYAEQIGIPKDKVNELTYTYYKTYGLAIRGLIKFHGIDPIAYDQFVDQSLPLETLLKKDENIYNMIKNLPYKRWAFTNANYPHAERVLRILGIKELFDGITYCDYAEPNFPCKPEDEYYERVKKAAGVTENTQCYLVDDSWPNLETAKRHGWKTAHVVGADGQIDPKLSLIHPQIKTVTDLPKIFPELWNKN